MLLGIPEVIVQDCSRLRRAVAEGEDPQSGWYYGWIKPIDIERLLTLLKEVPEFRDSYLLQNLERTGEVDQTDWPSHRLPLN